MTAAFPEPFPPVEPEPGPEHLTASIDWMTYSHQELWDMVNTGLDLARANAVAAQWKKLSKTLDEIGAQLGQAAQASASGWEGEGADKAREAVHRLTVWAADTGQRADEVAHCVTQQADNAETARRTMPEPPGVEAVPPRTPSPRPVPKPVGSTAAMSARSPFSAADFVGADLIATDPAPHQERAQQLHRRAAEVMERLQHDSGEVYGTVPQFTGPRQSVDVRRKPPMQTEVKPDPVPDPVSPPPEDTTQSSAEEVVTRQPVDRGPGADAGRPRVEVGGLVGPGGGSGAGTVEQLGAGARSGAGALGQAGLPGGSGMAAAAQRSAGGMGGAMPMGAPMGAGRRDDQERSAPAYLVETSDVWSPTGTVSPPVIGEDNSRGGR